MELSVIILNYNVRYFLELCLHSVGAATKDIQAEIIVIDNASSDESCAMVREIFPQIKLIANAENLGFPKGNNIGAEIATGKYLCILNPDTVIAEDCFTKLLAFAKKTHNLGIIGPKLIDGSGKYLPESKRGVPMPFAALWKISGLNQLHSGLNNYYASHLENFQTGKVDILVGAFMFMERELYLKHKGFDEDCFMYSDDIDLSYRVLESGLSNYYFPETTVIHFKGESTVRDAKYMERFRDAMHYFYKKHFKVPIFFDAFMNVGTFLFSQKKIADAKIVSHKISKYFLVSDDENLLGRLQNSLHADVSRISKSELNKSLEENMDFVQIIFDSKYLPFGEIIIWMENLGSSRATFRIVAGKNRFVIGSDSSNGRGEAYEI